MKESINIEIKNDSNVHQEISDLLRLKIQKNKIYTKFR